MKNILATLFFATVGVVSTYAQTGVNDDIATGKKLPSYSQYIEGCHSFTYDKDPNSGVGAYKFFEERDASEFRALSANDLFSYLSKKNMDDLDKAVYVKSSQYQSDTQSFQQKRNGKFAILTPFVYKDMPKFYSDGFAPYFQSAWNKSNFKNFIEIYDIIIPIKPTCFRDNRYFFKWIQKNSSIYVLKKMTSTS